MRTFVQGEEGLQHVVSKHAVDITANRTHSHEELASEETWADLPSLQQVFIVEEQWPIEAMQLDVASAHLPAESENGG